MEKNELTYNSELIDQKSTRAGNLADYFAKLNVHYDIILNYEGGSATVITNRELTDRESDDVLDIIHPEVGGMMIFWRVSRNKVSHI